MQHLRDNIYDKIKSLEGMTRVEIAFDNLKTSADEYIREKNSYGATKEVVKISLDGNFFTVTKGYAGKFEVAMYHEDRKIVGVSTIEKTKEGLVKGEFGIKLKDPQNPEWEKYVEKVVANKCFAEFKNISNLCITVASLLGVQIFTLSDQASAPCLLVSTPFNIFISILRLMVGKPSLYESIGFRPLHFEKLKGEISKFRDYTYGFLVKDRKVPWAIDMKIVDLIQLYMDKKFITTKEEMCFVVYQIAEILNRSIYYGDNSKYIRIVSDSDISTMLDLVRAC